MLKITSIQANSGDSFFIEDTDAHKTLLVDCGFKLTYQHKIKKLTSSTDYLILTHSDQDHIHGAIPLVQDSPDSFKVGKVYVNVPSSYEVGSQNGNISIRQAITLENLLTQKNISPKSLVAHDTITISKNLSLDIISPSQQDLDYFINNYKNEERISQPSNISNTKNHASLEELADQKDSYKSKKDDFTNAASIAFILKYKTYNFLFLGDAHPVTITDYLEAKGYSETKKHCFSYIKLSHHGSNTGISDKLISLVSCPNYIISTNGGKSRSYHPNRETLAKLALKVDRNKSKDINFYFNYPIKEIEVRTRELISSEEGLKYDIKLIEKNTFFIK